MDVFEPSTIEIAYSRYIVRPSLDPHSAPERSIPDTFANYVALKFSQNSITLSSVPTSFVLKEAMNEGGD